MPSSPCGQTESVNYSWDRLAAKPLSAFVIKGFMKIKYVDFGPNVHISYSEFMTPVICSHFIIVVI